jgi:hypothetical protein
MSARAPGVQLVVLRASNLVTRGDTAYYEISGVGVAAVEAEEISGQTPPIFPSLDTPDTPGLPANWQVNFSFLT